MAATLERSAPPLVPEHRRHASAAAAGAQKLRARSDDQFTPPEQVLFLPQVLENVKPEPAGHRIVDWPPGLMVREPLKAVLITPTFEQLSVMNAFAAPPVLSFVSLQRVDCGVTTTAVFEHVLVPPVVVQAGTGAGVQAAGQPAMHRPMEAGSPANRQLASQSLMQSAKARLVVAIAAIPAIDAINRFMSHS